MSFSFETLKKQNAETSSAIIDSLEGNEDFLKLSEFEGKLMLDRDNEDSVKLDAGINIGIQRGTLSPNPDPSPYKVIDVLGKSPQDIVDIIVGDIGDLNNQGALIVMCGLSGTGKGTVTSLLANSLASSVTWSNGNIFRSVTLLAVIWCEQNGVTAEINIKRALTDENIMSFFKMLSFEKVDGKWEVVINGLGIQTSVSAIENTDLKSPKVAKNIPTVAEVTQGEVINFAKEAISKMTQDGKIILLEGRQQTVNYIPTPYRYILTLSEMSLLGKRRAAQRLAAATLNETKKKIIVSEGPEGNVADKYQVNVDELVSVTLVETLGVLCKDANLKEVKE